MHAYKELWAQNKTVMEGVLLTKWARKEWKKLSDKLDRSFAGEFSKQQTRIPERYKQKRDRAGGIASQPLGTQQRGQPATAGEPTGSIIPDRSFVSTTPREETASFLLHEPSLVSNPSAHSSISGDEPSAIDQQDEAIQEESLVDYLSSISHLHCIPIPPPQEHTAEAVRRHHLLPSPSLR